MIDPARETSHTGARRRVAAGTHPRLELCPTTLKLKMQGNWNGACNNIGFLGTQTTRLPQLQLRSRHYERLRDNSQPTAHNRRRAVLARLSCRRAWRRFRLLRSSQDEYTQRW